MCGFCGIYYFKANKPINIDKEVIIKMRDTMTHRGPDDKGLYIDENEGVALAHTRLSIIDLSSAGRQPMFNEDKSLVLVFNGEIYNFRELKKNLSKHNFQSSTDSEVIIHLFEEEELNSISKLDGMFAFGIWDSKSKLLLLARDRLGKKPLYYYIDSERLIFASEIKAILEYGTSIERDLDYTAFYQYMLLGYVPYPRTLLKRIKKIPPGHYLLSKGDRIKIVKYWDIPSLKEVQKGFNLNECKQTLLSKLTDAVKKRSISDVPLGAFLSGGIDSSLVVGLLSNLRHYPVRTFSISFDIGESSFKYNVDSEAAKLVAKHFKTEHQDIEVRQKDITPEILYKVVEALDEPISNPSIISTAILAREARKSVTVVLSGDGGDESFGGYSRYQHDLIVSKYLKIPAILRRYLLDRMLSNPILPKRFNTLVEISRLPSMIQRYLSWWKIYSHNQIFDLIKPEVREKIQYEELEEQLNLLVRGIDTLNVTEMINYLDLKLWISEESNMRMDKMTMLYSMESRAPFLDQELVEFAASIPYRFKVNERSSKRILKQTFFNFLPREIWERPKWGFVSPAFHWTKGGLKDLIISILSRKNIDSIGLFNFDKIQYILSRHYNKGQDETLKIWNLLVLLLWYEIFKPKL